MTTCKADGYVANDSNESVQVETTTSETEAISDTPENEITEPVETKCSAR
jgi:hypothetical protein